MVYVEEFVEEARTLRYMAQRPLYQIISTYLNSHGGKDPKAKKLPASRVFTPEELMAPWDLPEHLQTAQRTPQLTSGEARAILGALPHLKGASWVLQALTSRVLPLEEIHQAAGTSAFAGD